MSTRGLRPLRPLSGPRRDAIKTEWKSLLSLRYSAGFWDFSAELVRLRCGGRSARLAIGRGDDFCRQAHDQESCAPARCGPNSFDFWTQVVQICVMPKQFSFLTRQFSV